jgi:nicotinamidase-related amidase
MKTLLLIIDMQNDFCMPNGALYIPGAEKDVDRLADFIAKESKNIDDIILTQDNHHVLDIAHPGFWHNSKGENPPAFINITYEDVKKGVWQPLFHKEHVVEYLRKLEEQGEYPHTVWPEHCLIGSTGAAIVPKIMTQIRVWAKLGHYYEVVSKGTHPLTEHFGAFRANIPISDAPETQLNIALIEKLRKFDRIILAGEAKSHCVANTIKQMFDFPDLIQKLTILDDCMTNVPNCEQLAIPIYKEAQMLGATFINTNDLTL